MRLLTRHFLAFCICVGVFSATGTLSGFASQLSSFSENPQGALAATWLLNVILTGFLCLVVVMPVTSIADYLFTYKWPFHPNAQFPLLILLLIAYLLPCSIFFGSFFFAFLLAGTIALVLPLLLYWIIFKGLDLYPA